MILVEGVDRAGKTTECRRIMALPRSRPRILIHFVAPPDGSDEYAVLREMGVVYRLAQENPGIDFVCDRGHVSWHAYKDLRAPRSVDPSHLRDFEHGFEGLVGVLVHCDAPGEELVARDDGASTWTRDTKEESLDAIQEERYLFNTYARASGWRRFNRGAWPA